MAVTKDKTMLLSMVKPGRTVRLVNVEAGRHLRSRLAAMGIVPGVELRVMNNNARGPFIVAVRDTRVMLGRGMAQKIWVS